MHSSLYLFLHLLLPSIAAAIASAPQCCCLLYYRDYNPLTGQYYYLFRARSSTGYEPGLAIQLPGIFLAEKSKALP